MHMVYLTSQPCTRQKYYRVLRPNLRDGIASDWLTPAGRSWMILSLLRTQVHCPGVRHVVTFPSFLVCAASAFACLALLVCLLPSLHHPHQRKDRTNNKQTLPPH